MPLTPAPSAGAQVTNPEDIAAREERINEAGLDAERIYWLMVEDEAIGIELVRAYLRMRAEVVEILNNTTLIRGGNTHG